MLGTLIYMLVAGLIAVLAVVLAASMGLGGGDRLVTRRATIPLEGDPLEAIEESLRSSGFQVYRSETGIRVDDQLLYWEAGFSDGLLIVEEGVRLWAVVVVVLLVSLVFPVGLVAAGYTYLRMRSLRDSVRAGLARAGAPLEALLLV